MINVGRHCRNCKEKYRNCHSDCFAYKVEKARREIERENEIQAKKESRAHKEYVIEKECKHRRY